MSEQYYIYLMKNKDNTVLYTGVTNDLIKRVYEHKEKLIAGFVLQASTT
jgi:putative endonuclease